MAIVVLARTIKLPKSLSANVFKDVPPSHENYQAITYVKNEGIVIGYPDETFKPDGKITRAESTKILIDAVIPGKATGENCFKDVTNQWFAGQVCQAFKDGIVKGYPDAYFRPNQPIVFSEAAKMITGAFRKIDAGFPNLAFHSGDPWYKKSIDELQFLDAVPKSIDNFSKEITRGEMAEIIYRLKSKNGQAVAFASPEHHKPPVNDYSIFTPPQLPENSRYNLPFPMDWDENGQPSKGIYKLGNVSFFDNDPRALEILQGKAVLDITDYGVCGFTPEPPVKSVKDDYGEKIFSALAQIGYFFPASCGSDVYNALYLFQKNHGLPESKIVDQATMQALDKEIRKIEKRDYKAAKDFVCSQYIIDAPGKGRSKNHLAFLYSLAMSAFPEELQIDKSRRGCFDGQTFQVSNIKRAMCDSLYWTDYDKNCELIKPKGYIQPVDDYEIVSTILHEHGHSIQMFSLKWGTVDVFPFYSISYDIKTKLELDDFYLKIKFDWDDLQEKKENLCSWYGLGWAAGDKYPGYFTPSEDFSECLRMYVMNGIPFRDAVKSKPVLKQKYEWLKRNVFEGREFMTGDSNYLDYVDDFYALSPAGMTFKRPEYVWDYNLYPIEGEQPLNERHVKDKPDDFKGPQIHFIYMIPSDGADEKLDLNGAIESSIRMMQGWLKARSFERSLRIDKYNELADVTFLKLKKTNTEMLGKKSLLAAIDLELKENGFDEKEKIYAVYYGGGAEVCGDSAWPPNKPGNVAVVYVNGEKTDGSVCGDGDEFKKRRYKIGSYYEYAMLREILHAMGLVAECYKYSEKDGFVSNLKDLMYKGSGKWQAENINSSYYDYFLDGKTDQTCSLLPGAKFLSEPEEKFKN